MYGDGNLHVGKKSGCRQMFAAAFKLISTQAPPAKIEFNLDL